MRYYPVCLDLKNKRCVVIGGGTVAIRKAKRLVECGAEVLIVSPEIENCIKGIVWIKKGYEVSDLDKAFLVVAATDNPVINRRVSDDATKANILVNVVDSPELSTFILPALLNRGDLSIAISTAGKCPALSKKIRQDLEQQFGLEYAEFIEILGELRCKIQAEINDEKIRQKIFEQLANSEIIQLIQKGAIERVSQLIEEVIKSFEKLNCS